jgi:hypothetical protein
VVDREVVERYTPRPGIAIGDAYAECAFYIQRQRIE